MDSGELFPLGQLGFVKAKRPPAGCVGAHGDAEDRSAGEPAEELRERRHGHEAAEKGREGAETAGPLVDQEGQGLGVFEEFDRTVKRGELGKHLHAISFAALAKDSVKVDVVERSEDARHLDLGLVGGHGLGQEFPVAHVRDDDDGALFLSVDAPGGLLVLDGEDSANLLERQTAPLVARCRT